MAVDEAPRLAAQVTPARAGRRPRTAPVDPTPSGACASSSSSTSSTQLATQARDWDELMNTIIERTTVALRRRRVLALPHGPRRRPADAGGHERPRPATTSARSASRTARASPGAVAKSAAADPGARRARGAALQVGARLRPPGHHLDAVRAADLERPRRRRDQRPDARRAATFTPGGDRVPRHDRGAARRHRREGPAPGGARGAAGIPDRARRRPRGAAEPGDPRAADARCRSCAPTSTCSATPPQGIGDPPPRASAEAWRDAAVGQVTRLNDLVDSILVAVRRAGPRAVASRSRSTPTRRSQETLTVLAPLLRSLSAAVRLGGRAGLGGRRRGTLQAGARASARERVEVRAVRPGRQPRSVAGRRRGAGLRDGRRAGHPARGLGVRVRAVRADRPAAAARVRASACSRRAA